MNKKSVLIIIVLYKKRLEESMGFSSYIENEKFLVHRHELIVYNNSPEIDIKASDNFTVITAKENKMLAEAYNEGLKFAGRNGFGWIMLIDHDTYLNAKYFKEATIFLGNTNRCKAAAPIIEVKGATASPIQYKPLLGPYFGFHPITKPGYTGKCLAAFNSGTLLDVEEMRKIGGFNEEYPLDSLDNWYYHQLYKRNCRIYIMDVKIIQNLSVADYGQMTTSRYKSVMNYSLKFAMSLGITATASWRLRNIGRCLIQLTTSNKRKFVPLTIQYLYKHWID